VPFHWTDDEYRGATTIGLVRSLITGTSTAGRACPKSLLGRTGYEWGAKAQRSLAISPLHGEIVTTSWRICERYAGMVSSPLALAVLVLKFTDTQEVCGPV